MGLLEKLLQQKGRLDDFCIRGVRDMMQLSLADIEIAKYIYSMPSHSYQYARYVDWFREYLDE
jgi:hypothetical protein